MRFVLLGVCLVLAISAQCPYQALNQIFGPDPNNAPVEHWIPPPFHFSQCSAAIYNQFASTIKAYVQNGTVDAPTFFRLGFHHCNVANGYARGYGCSGGWLHYPVDANAPQNAGLSPALDAIQEIRDNNPTLDCMTYADMYTFSAVLGLELAGGPPVSWYPGRADPAHSGPSHPPLSSVLPDGMFNSAGTQAWGANFGFTLRETVVLLGGGHTIGGADASGWEGSFTSSGNSWPSPANRYFTDLLSQVWEPQQVPSSGKTQFVCAACGTDPDGGSVIRFPSDMALRDASTFQAYSKDYAGNETLFVSDLQYAYQRLLQLGAGDQYRLLSSVFHWRGYQNNWNGYGTNMEPLMD